MRLPAQGFGKWRDAAIGAVLFGAMVVLAVLQYRWIGQVSEADRDRLQQSLRTAVGRFSDDFDGELERLVQVVQGGGAAGLPSEARPLAERVELWRGLASHPLILKGAWAADAPDLPTELQPLAGRLPRTVGGFRGGRGFRLPQLTDFAVPAFAVAQLRGELAEDAALQWTIFQLDRDYIQRVWLPELAARHFGPDYRVRVLHAGAVVWSSSEVGNEDVRFGEDVFAPLLQFRGGRGGRGGPPDFGKQNKQSKRGGFGDGAPGAGGLPFGDGWTVVASYRSGTLSELVEQLRRRNLAVSFGILLLMGVSIAMLMRSMRRANALALQQMEFVAGVTHELRTPLAVILSASQNLADGVARGEEQAKRYGGVIHSQTKRLAEMVEQVLRFAGLSSQHADLRRAPIEAAELAAEAATDCRSELAASGAELTIDVAAGLAPIDGDRAALLHALRNLLTNAAKHGSGAPVRLSARPAGPASVEICVEDAGPGIDPADLPHIFEPFYRGARAKQDQVKGSGLGLSLVKKIVEAHGGRVEAHSQLGRGARFRLLLPAARAA
jgi:signal transduction histidine kinase